MSLRRGQWCVSGDGASAGTDAEETEDGPAPERHDGVRGRDLHGTDGGAVGLAVTARQHVFREDGLAAIGMRAVAAIARRSREREPIRAKLSPSVARRPGTKTAFISSILLLIGAMSTTRSRIRGKWYSGRTVTGPPASPESKVRQAQRSRPLITMPHEPHMPTRQA